MNLPQKQLLHDYFDKEFELRYFEMNKFGEASPSTLLTLLEETAAEHCESIGHSLYDLYENNIGWVLLSGALEVIRYPRYKEKITIRTWLSNYSAIRGVRENLIYDEEGNIIVRAKGNWVFFDIQRRRPVRIYPEIIEQWSSCEQECLKHTFSKIPVIDEATFEHKNHVHRFDIDMNQHVNNIRYLHWLIESIPDEVIDHYQMSFIDGRFIDEAQRGDLIHSLTEREADDQSFIHAIKTSEGKVCATAKTKWTKR